MYLFSLPASLCTLPLVSYSTISSISKALFIIHIASTTHYSTAQSLSYFHKAFLFKSIHLYDSAYSEYYHTSLDFYSKHSLKILSPQESSPLFLAFYLSSKDYHYLYLMPFPSVLINESIIQAS